MLVLGLKERGVKMARRKHTAEQIINKLREAEVAISAGSTVAEVSRQIGVTQQTFYRWRTEYGGLKIDHYCPAVARLAHLMALESKRVTADVIDIGEFRDLAHAYNVMSVPKTVINDRVQFVGTVTEEVMVERVLQAVGDAEPAEEHAERASEQATAVK